MRQRDIAAAAPVLKLRRDFCTRGLRRRRD
jgi:hypothetical protein